MSKKKNKQTDATAGRKIIVVNKKARHDFFIDETYEAGLALEGWEVKAIRSGRAQLKEAYVLLRDGEAWLFGAHVDLRGRVARARARAAQPAHEAHQEMHTRWH